MNRTDFIFFATRMTVLSALLFFMPLANAISQTGLTANPEKATLQSSGAIVVNGRTLEKVVLKAESKGAVDFDYDDDAFPPPRAEFVASEKTLILFPVAKGSYRIRLLLWEEKKFQKITLVITDGPIPPPVPPPTPPIPPIPPTPPTPPVPTADKLSIVVVWESADSTPAVSRVMKDLDFWQSLGQLGHKWVQLDKDQKELDATGKETGRLLVDARGYRETITRVGLPTMLIFSQQGQLLYTGKLPDTTGTIRDMIRMITGR